MDRIFISYAREDLAAASRLYGDLQAAGFQPWLDKEDLLAGQPWEPTIRSAIKASSHFLALLSNRAIVKRGFYQSELRHALDVLREVPPGQIFVIPVRLEEVIPHHELLQQLQWVDLFPDYHQGLSAIVRAIRSGHLKNPEQAANTTAASRPLAPQPLGQSVPGEVLTVIQARAERDFPDDFSTRRGRISREIEAWKELQSMEHLPGVPSAIVAIILNRAERDFPDDFSTRRGRIRREAEAWQELQTLTPPPGLSEFDFATILNRAERDFPDDFSTRRGRIKREIEAWKELYGG
jgi:hypothetical protein